MVDSLVMRVPNVQGCAYPKFTDVRSFGAEGRIDIEDANGGALNMLCVQGSGDCWQQGTSKASS